MIAFVGFIFFKSLLSWKEFGTKIFYFNYKIAGVRGGIYFPLLTSLILGTLTLLIACPVALRIAILITYRNKNYKVFRTLKFTFMFLSALPSVLYGLFGFIPLSWMNKHILHMENATNLFSATMVLTLMCIPTMISGIIGQFQKVDLGLYLSGSAIGLSESKVIYQLIKKSLNRKILLIYLGSFAKVIGESAALSYILNSNNYLDHFNGIKSFFNSALRPLSVFINVNFFAENGGEATRSYMFNLAFVLLIVISLINVLIILIINLKVKKPSLLSKFKSWQEVKDLLLKKQKNYKLINTLYTVKQWFWEIVALAFTLIFYSWFTIDLTYRTLNYLAQGKVDALTNKGNFRALFNTFYIALVTILITFPFAFFVTVYFVEFSKNKKAKMIFENAINIMSSMPALLYGVFGSLLFLEICQLALGGKASNSLLAGSLTMSIMLFAFSCKWIKDALESVDQVVVTSAAALGLSESAILFKIKLVKIWPALLNICILMLAKIFSETTLFILTSGLNNSKHISLLLFGQTLTTRMYAQLSLPSSYSIPTMYYCAMMSFVTIFILLSLSEFLIPKLSKLKLKH
ncbi:ABC transporter permease subunit [Mycoplasmopsis caviae]|uniref:ABC transporter permease subunit n=1 Tax=Mycoplasmopsis caviae TaxID=55603 RepID=UPI001F3A67B4|nr:ABC transporter permease subunit [Mycoplasmopsis caviae]